MLEISSPNLDIILKLLTTLIKRANSNEQRITKLYKHFFGNDICRYHTSKSHVKDTVTDKPSFQVKETVTDNLHTQVKDTVKVNLKTSIDTDDSDSNCKVGVQQNKLKSYLEVTSNKVPIDNPEFDVRPNAFHNLD